MKIAVLTSSRADYGIYLPLLKKLHANEKYDLRIIVFGTHLSPMHGNTVSQIEQDGFKIDYRVETVMSSDTPGSITTSMGLTQLKFGDVWNADNNYDWIFCLGDRYEMFAAVAAGVPFNLKFVHLHGGETTLGAIDNQFRHSLSLFSTLHFTATEAYAERVKDITGQEINIHNVGALSLDNLLEIPRYSKKEFLQVFNIDLNKPTVLVTFHPETVAPEKNLSYTDTLIAVLKELSFQIIINPPNADTSSNSMRKKIMDFGNTNPNVIIVENFGTKGYFSCMQYCSFLMGNTSSGIIEAASLGKYVINLGDRQKGRAASENVITVPVEKAAILAACDTVKSKNYHFSGENIYYKKNVAETIIKLLEGSK